MLVTLLLPLLFLLVMSFHYVPKLLHEVVGIALLLLTGLHLYQNKNWLKNLRRGSWPAIRIVGTVVDVLLLAAVLVVVATGAGISNYLLKELMPLEIQRSIVIHQYHVSMPYALLILCGLHWGLHWRGWWGQWQKLCPWQLPRKIRPVLTALLCAAVMGLGIYGSFMNRVGDRLLMKHIFATEATNQPAEVYVVLLGSFMGLYVLLGFAAGELLKKRKN